MTAGPGPGKRRTPGRLRRWVLRPLIWGSLALLVVLAAAPVLLQTGWARARIEEEIERRVGEKLGRELEIGALRYELFPVVVEADGVRLANDRAELPPLVEAERVRLELDWPAGSFHALALRRIEVQSPLVRLRIGEEDDNVPRLRRSARPRRWQVLVDAVELQDARLELDQRRVLAFELHARGVQGELTGIGGSSVQGQVAIGEMVLDLAEGPPVVASAQGRVALGPEGLRLAAFRVDGEEVAGEVRGTIGWRPDPEVDLLIDARSDLSLVRRLGFGDGDLSGAVDYQGNVSWSREAWGFRGDVQGSRLELEGRTLEALRGRIAGDRYGVRLELESARYAGGRVSGKVGVEVAESGSRTEVDLELEGIDLERLCADNGIPLRGIGTRVEGAVAYGFEGAASREGRGWADVTLYPEESGGRVAIGGSATLLIDGGRVTSRALRLEGRGQRVLASGSYEIPSREGELEYSVISSDLGPVADLLADSLGWGDERPLWLPARGQGTAEGTLWLAPSGTVTELRVELASVVAPGLSVDRLRGSFTVSGAGVQGMRLELDRGTDQALLVNGSAGGEQVDLGIDAVGWPLADAAPWLPFELPVEGPVTGQLRLTGPPDSLGGYLDAESAGVRALDRELGVLHLELEWAPDRLAVTLARLETAGGELRVSGTVGLDALALDLEVDLVEIDPERAPLDDFAPGLGGKITGEVRVGGSWERPQVRATLVGRQMTVEGREIPSDEATFALLWEDGRLRARGEVPGLLSWEGGGRLAGSNAEIELEVASPSLASLLAIVVPGQSALPDGELSGTLVLRSAPGSGPVAELELPHVLLTYGGETVENLEPVRLAWGPEGGRVESLYFGGARGGEIFVAGTVGPEEDPRLALHLEAQAPAEWITLWLPEVRIDGRVEMLATIEGRVSQPVIDGQARLEDSRAFVPGFPHALEELRGVALFYPGKVVLDELRARSAGGRLLLGGEIDLGTGGTPLGYRFQLQAREISPRWIDGWWLRGDADLSLVSREDGRLLRGSATLSRAYYLQDLSVDPIQLVVSLLRGQRQEVGETDELLSTTALDIAVELPGSLRVRNNVAELDGRASLSLRGSMARPVVFGRVDLEPGGTLVYSETDYKIRRGALTFANPYRIEPLLDLVATTRVREYDVTLTLSGTLDRLQPSFSSDPPLPDLEVLRLLLTRQGPASGDLAAFDTESSANVKAASLLYGQAASLVSDRFTTLFGLDQFRIQPLSTGTGDFTSTTAVSVGKQLTSNLYASYLYDPSSTAERQLEVEWTFGRGKLLVFTQNSDGSYAVDLRFENRY